MKSRMYSIRDNQTNHYSFPFSAANDIIAKRITISAVQNPDSNIAQFPAAFDLYFIGAFDDESGHVDQIEPLFVESVINLKNQASSKE